MVELIVSTMPARGKRGYVAKVNGGEKKSFLRESGRSGYGSSHTNLIYKIQDDGIYEIQDANFGSSKIYRYFVKIENGEITQKSEFLSELILSENSVEMPKLEGSFKQIAWAESIRAKYAANLLAAGKKLPSQIYSEVSAKFYIENRNNLAAVLAEVKQEESIAGIVKNIKWVDTCPEDCRHESGTEEDGHLQGIVVFENGKWQKVEVLEIGKEIPPGNDLLGIKWRPFKSDDGGIRWCYPLSDLPCWED